ncbi:MAG: tetratricopeptide repeat protein [Candidatus Obscuribacterales bacterium]|nr:tetratricopeptide repeat protein [Candidatus Obscuribacterales bacterium]
MTNTLYKTIIPFALLLLATASEQVQSVAAQTVPITTLPASNLQVPQAQPRSENNGLELLYQGRNFYQQGRLPDALNSFKQFAMARPNNLSVHFWLGTVLDEMGRASEAVEEYNASLKLAASVGMDSPEVRINLGNSLCRIGHAKEARIDFERSLEIDKRYNMAYLGLAKCMLAEGDYEAAALAVEKYQRDGGTDINSSLLMGLSLAGQGQALKAQYHLRLFLKLAVPGLEYCPGRASAALNGANNAAANATPSQPSTTPGANTTSQAIELARQTLAAISDL